MPNRFAISDKGPILEIDLSGQLSFEDSALLARRLETRLDSGQPFACLIDLTDSRLHQVNNNTRFWKAWVAEHREKGLASILCSAIVVPDPMLREIIRAITLLVEAQHPLELFSDRAEARAWLDQQLLQIL